MVPIITGVLVTLNIVLTFLTLATAGRVSLNQRALVETLCERYNENIARLEELTEIIESSMDCLVAADAALDAETNPQHR